MELIFNVVVPWLGVVVFGLLGFRGLYCAIIFQRARNKARFAIEYGVWHRHSFGLELMLDYLHSLESDMNVILNLRAWSVPKLIEDKWIPYWAHCNEVKPVLASNEQILFLANTLKKTENPMNMVKTMFNSQKEGYGTVVDIKYAKDAVNEAVEAINSGEKCIIDIYSMNGMVWKHGPKQPENRTFEPKPSDN